MRSRNAGLPVIQVADVDGHRDRCGEIGVVQDDVWRLAPSSSVRRFIVSREFLASNFPICVEPVKAIFWMSGLCVNSVPTTSPRPVTTLMTPGGNPAS